MHVQIGSEARLSWIREFEFQSGRIQFYRSIPILNQKAGPHRPTNEMPFKNGPLSFRQRNAIWMTFRRWADGGPTVFAGWDVGFNVCMAWEPSVSLYLVLGLHSYTDSLIY